MGEGEGDGGVPHGRLLVRYAENLLANDHPGLRESIAAIRQQMGDAALVDTAAVAGLFNAIDRVADSTGIPMEAAKVAASADFRASLGINQFASMSHREAYE